MNNNTATRLSELRQLMNDNGVDYYYVPSADEHKNEYLPAYTKRRAWISNFTGTAGDVLIGKNTAYLWTDARYFLQAEQQLDSSLYELMKMTQGETPSIDQWLASQGDNIVCGVDPNVISIAQAHKIQNTLSHHGGKLLSIDKNLIDAIWTDRPASPHKPLRIQDVKYAGQSAHDKITQLRNMMKDAGANAHIITMLDAIAWLFNIRGNDISYNPLVISYAVVTHDQALLFVDPEKITAEDHRYLKEQHIEVRPYGDFQSVLNHVKGKAWVDPSTASWWVQQQLNQAEILVQHSPITLLKAIKNNTEQQGMRIAHQIDAVAMIKFLYWLEHHWQEGITEKSAQEKLDALRREEPRCLDLSFSTISGFGPNGAIVHYFVTEKTSIPIDDSSLYLIDSGGQYYYGTTDITRTIHLGTPTEAQKRHYTLVLKGHLAIRHCVFPDGVCGEHINALAHVPLWRDALDYGHATGHGVGCYLCVHEGPQGITFRHTGVPLQPGMVVSNEPGVYFKSQYGIRIENLCLITQAYTQLDSQTHHGPFYKFEDLTLVPYSRKLIDTNNLTAEEIAWVNEYHQHVYETIVDQLPSDELREWLSAATEPL
ncbi:aminopeptidase P family protein [Candidiatus Paracoxiella cheracis]|uniref:aminopeptidase P family protein n=1 Tax=Candidiatus Paracoxiella cheracis TaxID=3405120 RepID=UPI003BF52252